MSNLRRGFFSWFYYGNLYIGILAAGLTWTNAVHFGAVNSRIIAFNFFAAMFAYNLHRLFSFSSDYKNMQERTRFVQRNKNLLRIITLLCFFGLLILSTQMNFDFFLRAGFLGFLTLFYLVLFNRKSRKPRSAMAFIKPVLLALVWTLATFLLPATGNRSMETGLIFAALIRFGEYFANGIIFDYRDREADKNTNKENIFSILRPGFIFSVSALLVIPEILLAIFGLYRKYLPGVFFVDIGILIFFSLPGFAFLSINSRATRVIDKNIHIYTVVADGILILPVVFTVGRLLQGGCFQ